METVRKEAHGASAMTLLRTAQSQVAQGKDCERHGDLKGALSAFTKAAGLARMTITSAEFMAETRSKGGVLKREFTEFYEVCLLSLIYKGITDVLPAER